MMIGMIEKGKIDGAIQQRKLPMIACVGITSYP